MNRDDRIKRLEELREWVKTHDEEFRDEALPADVQTSWNQYTAEITEHEKILRELEERDAQVRSLARSEDSIERGSDTGFVRKTGVALISKMTERDVHDLSALRVNPFNPDGASQEIRDRARRANELAVYAHPGVDQARAKEHVEKLILRGESEDWQSTLIARRILATGNPAYKRAFAKVCDAQMRGMGGLANLSTDESRSIDAVRALTVGTGSQGGFAVPYTLDPTVIPTSNYSVNPMRQISRVEQITGLQWNGVTSAGVTAAYAAEAATAADSSPVFVQPTLNVIRAQCFVPVSFELAQDWPSVQSELAQLISDAKDDLEATQFTVGAGGATAPTGIVTGATTTQAAGGTASFAIADLYALEGALPPRFRPRASVIGNRFVFNKIRQFDTAGGSGVWNVGPVTPAQLNYPLTNGALTQNAYINQEILGYSAFEDTAMASALTTASKILVLGDFRYFIIVDRVGMDIEVIPHLFAGSGTPNLPTGQRGIYAFWRNNSNILSANAFRTLVTG